MADDISVGSVSVSVVPSAEGFPERMAAIVEAALKPATERITRSVSAALQQGFTDGGRTAAVSGERAAGAFADAFRTRVDAALRSLPSPRVGLDATELDAELADIRSRLAALSGARVGIDLSAEEATRELDALKVRLDTLAARSPDIQVRVDAATASAELATVQAQVAALDGRSVNLNTRAAETGVSTLLTSVVALGPALIPVGAAAVAGLGGIATVALSSAAGLGTVALAASGVAKAVKGEVEPAFQSLQHVATAGLLPGVEHALQDLLPLLPAVKQFVGGLADELGTLAVSAAHAFDSPFWTRFFSYISATAAPTLATLGHIVGNLAVGFAGLSEAFAPVVTQIGAGLEHLSAQFAAFGQGADHNSFQTFVAFVEQVGPEVVQTLEALGQAVGHVIVALAPLGGVALTGIRDVANVIDAIPVPVLTALAAGFVAVSVGMKATAIASALAAEFRGLATAFMLAGGGAQGLAASLEALNLNPVVLAVTAVVGVAAALTHVLDSQSAAAVHAGQAMAQTYIRSLDMSGTSLATATANTAALTRQMQNVSGSMGEQVGKLHDLQVARQQSAAQAKSIAANEAVLSSQYGISQQRAESLAKANGGLAGSTQEVVQRIVAAAGPAASLNNDLNQIKSSAKGSANAVNGLTDALDRLLGNFLSVKQAEAAFKDDLRSLDSDLKKSKGSLDESTKAGAAAHDQYLQTAAAISPVIEAMAKNGATTDAMRAKMDQLLGAFAKTPAGGQLVTQTLAHIKSAASNLDLGGKGRKNGQDFALGVVLGLHNAAGAVEAAAAALGSRVNTAFRSHEGISASSPSKKGYVSGQDFGRGVVGGVMSMTAAVRAAGASLGSALSSVMSTIANAVAPTVTDPSVLASILAGDTSKAVHRRVAAGNAHDQYVNDRDAAKAADDHAKSLRHVANEGDRAAQHAKSYADSLKDSTKAEKDAKAQAEQWAHGLAQLAKDNDQSATAAEKAARRADNAAAKSKQAWDEARDAAKSAAQQAASAAQALVSSMSDSTQQMLSTITDFESTISGGLTGDYSLSTLWGNLVNAQSQAASDLATAQQNYQSAQDAVTEAGAAATADQLQSLTDARNALTAAQAAADQANAAVSPTGLQDSLDAVLANTKQFATDLQALVGEGASQALLSQIVAMGPTAGDALVQQLLAAGKGSVTQLSSTLDQIAAVSSSAADKFADEFYGGGVAAMANFVKGLEVKFPELKKALDPILTELAGVFGTSTTGTLPGSGATASSGFGGSTALTPGIAYNGVRSVGGSSAVLGGDGASLTSTGDITVYAQFGDETVKAQSVKAINQFGQTLRQRHRAGAKASNGSTLTADTAIGMTP